MKALTIGRLAQAGGVGVETIRYYQRRGLLRVPSRGPDHTTRRYEAADLGQLRFIRSAQASGFTLDQIKELLSLDAAKDRQRARELTRQRIAALDQKIAVMRAARRSLLKLADSCERSRDRCPILPY
jgi:MerR family mercuric resistance operon transcriptional regulator